jgi:hypothetical protein
LRGACLALGLGMCAAARAQEPRETAPSTAPAAEPSADEQAAERFRRGVQLFEDGDFAPALIEFERAYSLSPNYRALYNIGLVNVQLGRYAAAVLTLRRYLADGIAEIPAERRAEVEEQLRVLALRTATLTLTVEPAGAELKLDGKPIVLDGGQLLLDAGEHVLEASAPGFRAQSHSLKLAGQDQLRLDVRLEALPAPVGASAAPSPLPVAPAPRRQVFWPGVGATAALAGGAVVSGAIMLRARAELDTLKGDAGSPASERDDAARRANVAAVSADVFTVLAVAAGGVTLYLSLRRRPASRAPDLAVGARSLTLAFRLR